MGERRKIEIGQLIEDEFVFPRTKKNIKTIEEYRRSLQDLPAIEIQRVINYPDSEGEVFIVLDGIHRLAAHICENKEEIEVVEWQEQALDYDKNKLSLKLRAAELNTKHGDRLIEQDKKETARTIAQNDPYANITEETIAQSLLMTQPAIHAWISDIRQRQRASKESLIIKLSCLGWKQEEIAEIIGFERSRVTQIVNNISDYKINNLLAEGRDMAYIADALSMDMALAWAMRFAENQKTDKERFEELGWGLRTWDNWYFSKCDERFGDDWPGRIPAQLVAHALFFFTTTNDIVLDPMAGGGVVSDVCLLFGRKCFSFDVSTRDTRLEIREHYWNPINLEWPEALSSGYKNKPSFIFFDAPYFSKKEKEYENVSDDRSISSLSRNEYLQFMKDILELLHENSTKNTRLAFLNADWRDFQSIPAMSESPEEAITMFDYRDILSKTGWMITHRIETPLSTERFSGNMVEKMQEKRILGTVLRTLLMARK